MRSRKSRALRTEKRWRTSSDGLERRTFLYEQPYLNLCNGVWINAINEDANARWLRVLLVGAAGNASFSYYGMHRLSEIVRGGALFALLRESAMLLRGRANDLTPYTAISTSAAAGLAATDVDFAYQPIADTRAAQVALLGRVDVGNYDKGTLCGQESTCAIPAPTGGLSNSACPFLGPLSGGRNPPYARPACLC